MLKKITNYLAKTFLIALMALFNFLFRSLIVKFLVSISIPKTITYITFASFKLFFDIFSKLVIKL